MPWTPSDGPNRHTHKADSPQRKRVWAKVANSALERTGNDADAIKEANAVMNRIPKYGHGKK